MWGLTTFFVKPVVSFINLVVHSSEEYWLLLSDGSSCTGRPALLHTVMTTLLAPELYLDVGIVILQNYDGHYFQRKKQLTRTNEKITRKTLPVSAVSVLVLYKIAILCAKIKKLKKFDPPLNSILPGR